MVKHHKVGTPKEWPQFVNLISHVFKGQDITDLEATYTLVKSLLKGDALQVFQNEEAVQKERDVPSFTKCLQAVTKHVFPIKACKIQKKYICNICKPLRLGSCEWISCMIKLNNYLTIFSSAKRSNYYQVLVGEICGHPRGWNSIPVETGVQERGFQFKLFHP
eukprot:12073495-Ditylum_brightwellii.AAC.2